MAQERHHNASFSATAPSAPRRLIQCMHRRAWISSLTSWHWSHSHAHLQSLQKPRSSSFFWWQNAHELLRTFCFFSLSFENLWRKHGFQYNFPCEPLCPDCIGFSGQWQAAHHPAGGALSFFIAKHAAVVPEGLRPLVQNDVLRSHGTGNVHDTWRSA